MNGGRESEPVSNLNKFIIKEHASCTTYLHIYYAIRLFPLLNQLLLCVGPNQKSYRDFELLHVFLC